MSLLNRIAEQQGATKQQDTERQVGAQEEAQKPNAVEEANQQRANYSQAVAQTPDQDLTEEIPDQEEQEAFTAAERQMAEIVYGAQASEKIQQAVANAQDPVAGVGKMAAEVLRATLAKAKGELSEDAVFALGETAVEQLVEVLESKDNTINMTDDQMSEALSVGVGHWMKDNPGDMGDKSEYLQGDAPDQLAPQDSLSPMDQMGQQAQQAQPPTQGV